MKHKKVITIFGILLIIILLCGYFGIRYVKNKETKDNNEYTPEQEITDDQARQTIVSLYFVDSETGELHPEARLVDIKDLMNLPYEKLANLLIEGPKNDKLKGIFPENTKVLKSYTEGDCLVLDFSSEILNYSKDDSKAKENLINSVVNTMTELTEINRVRFLVDGTENDEFKGEFVRK